MEKSIDKICKNYTINESPYLYGECITNKEIKERYSEYLD